MDITNNSLIYFNQAGLELIAEGIVTEFRRMIQEDNFEDTENFKTELETWVTKLENEWDDPIYVLQELVAWLNTPDNMEAFGSEGWEHACGLDFF